MKIEHLSLSDDFVLELQKKKKKDVISYLKANNIGTGVEKSISNKLLNKYYEAIKTYRVSQ
jgi:hypothetical protein